MKNWFLFYATPNMSEASIVKGLLEENHIQVMVLNRQDSSYLNFGEIELYVPAHLKEVAQQLRSKVLLN